MPTEELFEKDLVPGDIFRSSNGNLYLVLPNLWQVYLGNERMSSATTLAHLSADMAPVFIQPRPHSEAVWVGHIDPSIWTG